MIGVVGTVRFGRGWSASELKNVGDIEALFTSFYWICDFYGTIIAR